MRAMLRVCASAMIVSAAFTVDQLTKAWALAYLGTSREIELGLGATLRLVFNPGVAFGLGGDLGAPLAIGIAALTLGLLVWIALRAVGGRSMPATAFLALAAGGAIGNLWDRITRAEGGPLTGQVVDFIAVDWFAIFNVADIFTTLGLAGWAILLVLQRDRTARQDSSADTVIGLGRPS